MKRIEELNRYLEGVEDPLLLLKSIFALCPVAFIVYAPDGTLLFSNPALADIFGEAPPPGYNVLKDSRPSLAGVMHLIRRAFAGESVALPFTHFDASEVPDRRNVTVVATYFPIHRADGTIQYVVSTVRNVTSELEDHTHLIENRAALERMQDLGRTGVFTHEIATRHREWSQQMFEIFGFERRATAPSLEELFGRVHPEDRSRSREIHESLISGQHPVDLEHRLVMPDGKVKWIHVRAEFRRDESGAPVRAFGVVQDITALKNRELEAQAKLEESLHFLERSQAQAKIGTWVSDLDTTMRVWSRQTFEIFGVEPGAEPPGPEEFRKLVHPDDWEPSIAAIDQAIRSGPTWSMDRRIVVPGGEVRTVRVNGEVLRDAQGKPQRLVGTIQDITESLRTRHELKVTEERYQKLFNSDILGVFLVDFEGNLLEANDRFLSFTGYTRTDLENGAINWRRMTPPGYEQIDDFAVNEVISKGTTQPFAKEYVRKDGSRIPVLVGGAKLHASGDEIICFALDLTDIRRLEVQVERVQRLEAMGRFAGGVAHDFNNLLGVILLQADEALAHLHDTDSAERVRQIKKAAERATSLTRQILAFSRRREAVFEGKVLDLNTVVREMAALLKRLLGETIQLSVQFYPQPALVRVDPVQIEQMLMNLVLNSRDAMPGGGQLEIRVDATDVGEEHARSHQLEVSPGKFCRISVSDTGHGMDRKTLSRIYEPFFTTKPPGKGTGLGLPTVYGTMQQSGGGITVESAPGKGATFALYFPCADGFPQETPEPIEKKPLSPSKGRVVLLVEDEDALRTVTAELLKRNGYRVIQARNGEHALEMIQRGHRLPDVIVTDVIMPEMIGPKFVERMGELYPDLSSKVLYISGYTAGELERHGLAWDKRSFLEKPYTARVLMERIEGMFAPV